MPCVRTMTPTLTLAAEELMNFILSSLINFISDPSCRDWTTGSEPRTRSILLPTDSIDAESRKRLEKLNFEIILFDRLDNNYSGLDQVWRETLRLTRGVSTPPMRAFDPFAEMPSKI